MTIGLLDHMGYGNLGDAAIQEAVIANIRKRIPNVRIVAFSLVPADTVARHGIDCYPINWSCQTLAATRKQAGPMSFRSRLKSTLKANPFVHRWAKPVADLVREAAFCLRSYRILRGLDVLIVSGGGQLSELWNGPWSHPYTIFKFSLLAKLARRKLFFLNVGAGPLLHPLSKFFTRCALRLADYRSFRDDDSRQLLRSLGVRARMHVCPDPAYGLDVSHLRNAARGTPMPIVGLNPFGFCDPRIWPRKDNSLYQDYVEKIAAFAMWLIDQGYTLRVFTTEISVDCHAIEDLRTRIYSKFSPELVSQIFPDASTSVADVLQQMSSFDLIVTSKFHGLIFSHLLAKPVISLSYQRKMDVAMHAVGQSRFNSDVEHFDTEWLIQAFRSLVDESSNIKLTYATSVEAFAAALSRQFDGLFGPAESLVRVNSSLALLHARSKIRSADDSNPASSSQIPPLKRTFPHSGPSRPA
jgi:polysaccharide pyruvyl transferase WcaK-like protein